MSSSFLVHAKPRAGSTPVYKVKSVLRGTETEGLSLALMR